MLAKFAPFALTPSFAVVPQNTQEDFFRFVESGTELIETESGLSKNETVGYATKTAIEAAVYAIIQQGIELDMWDYKEGE